MILSKQEQMDLLVKMMGIARRVNIARFEGRVPTAEDTVDLCELTDVLLENLCEDQDKIDIEWMAPA